LNKKEQFCRIEAQKWAKFGGRNNNIFKQIVGGGGESRIARPPRRRPPRRQPPKVFRPARKSRAGAAKTVRLPKKKQCSSILRSRQPDQERQARRTLLS
jgi:hypothetical protein